MQEKEKPAEPSRGDKPLFPPKQDPNKDPSKDKPVDPRTRYAPGFRR